MEKKKPKKGNAMAEKVSQHFVTFYSPSTFFAENTTRPIDSWDVKKAATMAKTVVERYEARPYGFRFSTRERGPKDLDSRVVKTSAMYFLGGIVETVAQVKARGNPDEKILLSNMECNGWDRIVRNDPRSKGWAWTQPLEKDDVVLEGAHV